jgi:hypothetical protein
LPIRRAKWLLAIHVQLRTDGLEPAIAEDGEPATSFPRPVDRTSISTTTFTVNQGPMPVAGMIGFEFGDIVVTFQPRNTLAPYFPSFRTV